MSEAYKRHIDKRISEMRDRTRNSKIKKQQEVKIFSQRVGKAWKNANKMKSN